MEKYIVVSFCHSIINVTEPLKIPTLLRSFTWLSLSRLCTRCSVSCSCRFKMLPSALLRLGVGEINEEDSTMFRILWSSSTVLIVIAMFHFIFEKSNWPKWVFSMYFILKIYDISVKRQRLKAMAWLLRYVISAQSNPIYVVFM